MPFLHFMLKKGSPGAKPKAKAKPDDQYDPTPGELREMARRSKESLEQHMASEKEWTLTPKG